MLNTKTSLNNSYNKSEQEEKRQLFMELVRPIVRKLLKYPYIYKQVISIIHIKRKIFRFLKLLIISCFNNLKVFPEIPFSSNFSYYYWLLKNYPRKSDLKLIAQTVNYLNYQPKIIIVLINNREKSYLNYIIESVLNQIYCNWELEIIDDAKNGSLTKSIIEEYAQLDSRIKVIEKSNDQNISTRLNSVITTATGEFIAFLQQDGLLTPNALYEFIIMLNQYSDADMIYSDEDKITSQGSLEDPCFKPDWCPDSFLSRMYTGNFCIYRKELIEKIGGFRSDFEKAKYYDLGLRFTEKTDKIYHIPKILYHSFIDSASHEENITNKKDILEATYKALTEAINRRKEKGELVLTSENYYIVRYEIKDPELVSIVIPTKNLGKMLDRCLESIFTKTIYSNYEVILIDNGTTDTEALEIIKKWQNKEPDKFRVKVYDIPFNYPKINNYGVQFTRGKYLLFLNNDIEIITPDWINAMVEQAQRPSIGAVGSLLLYPDNTVQHAGVMGLSQGVAGHSHKHYNYQESGYFGQLQTINNYAAVTAACLMCRKEVFEQVGGFEEALSVAFNDVDFCFKILTQGYRNIYLPHVKLYHYESKSRGYENTPEKRERFAKETEYMRQKWSKLINNDPCYSPNLTQNSEDFSININN